MTTHDYTHRYWGHDYYISEIIDGGMQLKLGGWGHGIKKGDLIILPNDSESTRYRVDEVDYHADPPDMWFAMATFAPRQSELSKA